jgi:hypothetical protein
MSEFRKMLERKYGGAGMVEHDVRNSRNIAVAGDRYERDLRSSSKRSIHGDQTFHRPLLQQVRIFFNQLFPVPVAHHKIEIAFLQQMIFNSRHHQGGISFANLRYHHANRVTPLLPQ